MHYIILIYGDEKSFAQMANDPKPQEQMYAAYGRYGTDMQEAGVLRGGAELKPTLAATTVRVRNGKTVSTDGPFAETKEQLAGYYVIECESLDDAIEIAAAVPGARSGTIEIRPQVEGVGPSRT